MSKLMNGSFTKGKPKQTRQGQGTNSKPRKGKKLLRGQGK